MKSAVITFPGSNCDRDAVDALQKIGAKIQKIWHQETKLDDDLDLIVIPGGFSYGDYLRSGAMAAISPVMQEVKRLAAKGVKVLGICNGFQILTESGLLPGVLTRNAKMKFICRAMNLRVENTGSAFTRGYKKHQIIRVPMAHMDGNYFADAATLKKLEDQDLIAFRYVDENGNLSDAANANGSLLSIAGIFNEQKNVLGMMPHPERAIDVNAGSDDGLALFSGLMDR
ncbi:MAG: phosphoribosylformylglycinamidine synthase subunit PurQ [Alphaproteobacteria bacterium]|nr:phosphoribosylformylglycinamidine synthase subunit PurQ [Alphaproteobacteria bacterium]